MTLLLLVFIIRTKVRQILKKGICLGFKAGVFVKRNEYP